MSSLFSKMFGATNTNVQQQPAGSTPGNMLPANANPANANNPTLPAANVIIDSPNASPLDAFANMWEPDANPAKPEAPIFAGFTPAAIQSNAAKNDFMRAVSPEVLAAIQAGGEGAVAATLAAMQAMAQKGYGDSTLTTTKLIEKALAKQQETFMAALPNHIKSQTVANNLRESNPIFSHPAAAPILEMFRQQAQTKNPTATATELQQIANQYLEAFATAAQAPGKVKAASTTAAQEEDWETFFK